MSNNHDEARIILDTSFTEQALHEVGYKFNNRPDWVKAPLRVTEAAE